MKKILYCAMFIVTAMTVNIDARVRTIQTEREFDKQLKKSNLLMILFYEGSKADKNKMGSFFRMYEAVSSKKMYDDADIVFTKLNMKNSSVSMIADRYGIQQSPCFILFINGNPVTDSNGALVQLSGFVSEKELHHFIQSYLSHDIKRLVKEKEQNRKERDIKAQEEWDPYFYPAVYYAPEYDFSWQKPLKYDAEGNEIQ